MNKRAGCQSITFINIYLELTAFMYVSVSGQNLYSIQMCDFKLWCSVNEISALLGHYVAQIDNLPTFQDNLLVPLSRTKQLLKMEPICCPDTSVTNYQFMLPNIPKEWKSQYINVWLYKWELECCTLHWDASLSTQKQDMQ